MRTVRPLRSLFALLLAALLVLLLLPGLSFFSTRAQLDEAPQILLQYASFDPLAGEPMIPAEERQEASAPGQRTYILQFTGPVQREWKTAVEQAGGQIYSYIPEYAFLVRLDPVALENARGLSFVRWVGDYHPAYRIEASLQTAAVAAEAAAQAGGEAGVLDVSVATLPATDLVPFAAQAAEWNGALLAQSENEYGGVLRMRLPAARVRELAAMDGVVWVEAYVKPILYNDTGGGGVMKADNVRASLGLYGSGQIVAVADSGLDIGVGTSPNPTGLHPDVFGRVISVYCLGRPGPPCDWSDYVSHGTHVVGSVLGNGSIDGSSPAAHQYTGTYAGVAPEANLVFQALGDATGGLDGIPLDEGDLMRTAYTDNARIHTNSWGAPVDGSYNLSSRNVDVAAWQRRDMLILFAAGNSGEDVNPRDGVVDLDSIGSPGTAKNILTVGASENNRPSIPYIWGTTSYADPIGSDLRADNPSGMAAFSSRGPTDDGRVKPDISAPGTYIASMRTRQYVFNDNLENGNANYITVPISGGAGTWQYVTSDAANAHSGTDYYRETANGTFTSGAYTFLFTPSMDVRKTGGVFDVHFWHKYNLSTGDRLVVVVDGGTGSYPGLILGEVGANGTYAMRTVTLALSSLFVTPPASVRIGFGIQSDGSSNSTWWLDDLRVDGADWGTLSKVNLAAPGDALDEGYLLMGGTSMATPLTAGAAALVREWLTEVRGLASPSGALMKAVMINGAADMSPGQYGTGTTREIPALRPNNVTGWGRVDLLATLNPGLPRQIWLADNTTGLSTSGTTATYTVTIGWDGGLAAEPATAFPAEKTGGTWIQAADYDEPLADPGTPEAPVEPRPVELKIDQWMTSTGTGREPIAPAAPQATVTLALDDGSHEGYYNLGTSVSFQYIWMNRFTPAAGEFPFNLEQIWVMYDDPQGVLQAGDAIDLAVYQDADGDPSNGATLLAVYHTSALAVDGVNWSVYNLSPALAISGPGDVLIAAINRYVVDGVTPVSYAATMDTSSSQGRAWRGWWILEPPDPPALPPDLFFAPFNVGDPFTGSWMIRGYGNTTGTVPTPTFTPTVTPPPGGSGGPLRITLAWTDAPGTVGAAKALVNDLDLEVIAPNGTTHYYGNAGVYSGGQCLRGGLWDACNNVEGVIIPNAAYGTYTIRVHGFLIASGPQPFALAAAGDNILGNVVQQSLYLPVLMR